MELPNKKYNTIVIDPPYPITMSGEVRRGREKRAKKLKYKTMSLEEIKNIPLGNIANKGCHVYCWTTNKMLRETFEILDGWGVNFHLVLVMTKPSGIAPCMGYVFGTEFCLLGFYGKPMQKFLNIGKLNWFTHLNKHGNHSHKPDKFYDLVRQMSPEPRIDIFSRREIKGFDVWGDEAPKLTLSTGDSKKEKQNDL